MISTVHSLAEAQQETPAQLERIRICTTSIKNKTNSVKLRQSEGFGNLYVHVDPLRSLFADQKSGFLRTECAIGCFWACFGGEYRQKAISIVALLLSVDF